MLRQKKDIDNILEQNVSENENKHFERQLRQVLMTGKDVVLSIDEIMRNTDENINKIETDNDNDYNPNSPSLFIYDCYVYEAGRCIITKHVPLQLLDELKKEEKTIYFWLKQDTLQTFSHILCDYRHISTWMCNGVQYRYFQDHVVVNKYELYFDNNEHCIVRKNKYECFILDKHCCLWHYELIDNVSHLHKNIIFVKLQIACKHTKLVVQICACQLCKQIRLNYILFGDS